MVSLNVKLNQTNKQKKICHEFSLSEQPDQVLFVHLNANYSPPLQFHLFLDNRFRSTSISCSADPLLCHSLNLSDNTFGFRVIFQSCSLTIIFCFSPIRLLFLAALQQRRQMCQLSSIQSRPPSCRTLATPPANLYRACPLPALCLPACLPS